MLIRLARPPYLSSMLHIQLCAPRRMRKSDDCEMHAAKAACMHQLKQKMFVYYRAPYMVYFSLLKYAPAISPSYLHYWYINTYQSRYNLKATKVLCNVIWTKDAEQTIWYSYCESSGWNRELDRPNFSFAVHGDSFSSCILMSSTTQICFGYSLRSSKL